MLLAPDVVPVDWGKWLLCLGSVTSKVQIGMTYALLSIGKDHNVQEAGVVDTGTAEKGSITNQWAAGTHH